MHDHGSPAIVPVLEMLLGGSPASNPAMYQQSSPINFVNAQSPPTLILQGDVDPLVSPTQSAALNTKLQTMGVLHQYILYSGEGHGWVGTNLVNSFNSIQAFLTANVN
jgi:dipeptidyl aminopeptidase/acylaminoacyl peptidase